MPYVQIMLIVVFCIILVMVCNVGTVSDDGDTVHDSVSGYYDNNNQYRYKTRDREHVAEHPYTRVDHWRGARGSSSLTRRPLPSHHRYHSAAAAAVLEEEVDMSYEVCKWPVHLCHIQRITVATECGRLWCSWRMCQEV